MMLLAGQLALNQARPSLPITTSHESGPERCTPKEPEELCIPLRDPQRAFVWPYLALLLPQQLSPTIKGVVPRTPTHGYLLN
jgi:hypothetical protein